MFVLRVRTICGSGWVKSKLMNFLFSTRPLPQAVLTYFRNTHTKSALVTFFPHLANNRCQNKNN